MTLTLGDVTSGSITTTGTGSFSSTITAASGSKLGNITVSNSSITSENDNLSFGASNVSTTGTLNAGNTTIGTLESGNATITGTLNVSQTVSANKAEIDSLTLKNGSITDSGNQISFGTNNLVTTGTLNTGNAHCRCIKYR